MANFGKVVRVCELCQHRDKRSPNRLLSISLAMYVPPNGLGEQNGNKLSPRLILCENCFAKATAGGSRNKELHQLSLMISEKLVTTYKAITEGK